jgi:signal transduction protein with GAF and PtsI domain
VLEAEPCADTAAILVREGKVLRVAAAVGLEQGEADGAFVDLGRGFAGRIAAERRPLALRSACTDPLVTSGRLRGRGVQALYGVPLMAGDELLGIATVGSISRPEFPEELKTLFRTVAARAATIMWGAALLERERRACARAAHLEEALRALEADRGAAGPDAGPLDAPAPLQ